MKLIGRKKIMTQIFDKIGNVIPVTVLSLNRLVLAKKTEDKAWIGFGKKNKFSKSEKGNFKELGFVPLKVIQTKLEYFKDKKIGDKIDIHVLKDIKKIDISGLSKGKGFAGVVKRWGFSGGPKTHGQSDRLRAPGSIGAGTDPSRVFKGRKMPGRMGGKIVTIKNLKVVKIDKENQLVFVKGSVPGTKNCLLELIIKD